MKFERMVDMTKPWDGYCINQQAYRIKLYGPLENGKVMIRLNNSKILVDSAYMDSNRIEITDGNKRVRFCRAERHWVGGQCPRSIRGKWAIDGWTTY